MLQVSTPFLSFDVARKSRSWANYDLKKCSHFIWQTNPLEAPNTSRLVCTSPQLKPKWPLLKASAWRDVRGAWRRHSNGSEVQCCSRSTFQIESNTNPLLKSIHLTSRGANKKNRSDRQSVQKETQPLRMRKPRASPSFSLWLSNRFRCSAILAASAGRLWSPGNDPQC